MLAQVLQDLKVNCPLQVYQDLFVDQDPARTEHIFERLADPSGSIDIVGWSQGIRLQVCPHLASPFCNAVAPADHVECL